MLQIKRIIFNPFQVNTYILFDDETKDAVVVDPGMLQTYECKVFDDFIKDNKLKINLIINTHIYLDHIFGDNYVRDRYGVKIAANTGDANIGNQLQSQAKRFGIHLSGEGVNIDHNLEDGGYVCVGKHKLQILSVPGHSPGSIALYCGDGQFVIAGDVLFRQSIGRTDLEGGNLSQLIRSIQDKLLTLPDNTTTVLPGHDSSTTIGEERLCNPYI